MKTLKVIIILFVMSSVMLFHMDSFAWWSVTETNYMDMNMVYNQANDVSGQFYIAEDYGEDNLVPYNGNTGIADTDISSCPSGTCYFDIVLMRDLPYYGSTTQFFWGINNVTSETWTDFHLEFWDSSFQSRLTNVPLLSLNSHDFNNSSFDGSTIDFTSPWHDIMPWSTISIDFTLNVDQMPLQFGIRQVATVGAVVPEPISSTLFLVGGATLGLRRFRKKFKK
jgi:hypothetical protein